VKLQKATQYGLYAALELARDPSRQLSAVYIADKYDISSNHLAKVLRDLGRAGLVDSVRGAGGGYRFASNAKRVTLMDVINIFENLGSEDSSTSGSGENTDIGHALFKVCNEIDEITQATFGSITLDTLLKIM
jgi:Rrf2 family nitric oxide-sensitive transcriptional repressor